MGRVSILTVVPANMAKDLIANRVVKDYNTLPQINKNILEAVREYMTERVGYSNLPMAGLSKPKSANGNIVDNLSSYLPINSKENVIFQLDMPSDMIISVRFNDLLEASADVSDSDDYDEIDFIKEEFKEKMSLGLPADDGENTIVFIPYLDVEKCNLYAKVNENFEAEELNLPGLERISLRELTSFFS
ncbi:hypothetical protein AALB53_08540 [Lachnospiraceae bacterium 47-T17]